MIIRNADVEKTVAAINKINGADVVKAWEPTFELSASKMFIFARIAEAIAVCYRKVAKNTAAKEAIVVIIDRMKVHLATFVKSVMNDIELLSACGQLDTAVDGDFAPLKKAAEKARMKFLADAVNLDCKYGSGKRSRDAMNDDEEF